jgi:hypothetical protein
MMKIMRAWLLLPVACLVATGVSFAADYTDIRELGTDTHDVRFVSGHRVYVEGLVNGMWEGRYWSAGGRINVPYELIADDAFRLHTPNIRLESVGDSELLLFETAAN